MSDIKEREMASFCGVKGRSAMSKAIAAVVVGAGFVILAGGANAAADQVNRGDGT